MTKCDPFSYTQSITSFMTVYTNSGWAVASWMTSAVETLQALTDSYLLSGSSGNMHSIRNSCAVMDCGVPTVVISEK